MTQPKMDEREARDIIIKAVETSTDYPYRVKEMYDHTFEADVHSVAHANLHTAALAMKEAAEEYEQEKDEETVLSVLAFALFIISQAPILLQSGVIDIEQVRYLIEEEGGEL